MTGWFATDAAMMEKLDQFIERNEAHMRLIAGKTLTEDSTTTAQSPNVPEVLVTATPLQPPTAA